MPDAERYRRFAEECLVMAEEEDNCGPRLSTLLEMAMTWMQLAQKANIDALANAGSHSSAAVCLARSTAPPH